MAGTPTRAESFAVSSGARADVLEAFLGVLAGLRVTVKACGERLIASAVENQAEVGREQAPAFLDPAFEMTPVSLNLFPAHEGPSRRAVACP